jgi:hypothetical protein
VICSVVAFVLHLRLRRWQVHGAADAALTAAAADVRSELRAAAPPPERAPMEVPSLQLAEDLLSLARRLAAVAAHSLNRSTLYDAELPGLQVGPVTEHLLHWLARETSFAMMCAHGYLANSCAHPM